MPATVLKPTEAARRGSTPQPLHAVHIADALLRLSTVQAVLGLGKTSIYAREASGELIPVRMGKRCTRWRAADVQRFLQAQGK